MDRMTMMKECTEAPNQHTVGERTSLDLAASLVAGSVYWFWRQGICSSLLAVVGAGLVMGSYGRRTSFSDRARQTSQDVWEFFGSVANSFLFLFLGIQIGESSLIQAVAGIGLALAGVVIGRAIMIYTLLPLHDAFARRLALNTSVKKASLFLCPQPLPRRWRPVLLLSGLRGALSGIGRER